MATIIGHDLIVTERLRSNRDYIISLIKSKRSVKLLGVVENEKHTCKSSRDFGS